MYEAGLIVSINEMVEKYHEEILRGNTDMYCTLNSGSPKTRSLKTKAFTLIELLVVIAIIALLMAVIIPALKLAKQKGASAVCLANVKQLTACWYMYQGDHDGEIVSSNPSEADGWVKHPFQESAGPGNPLDPESEFPVVTDEDEQRGIRAGLLYPYIDAVDVFHCPGDNIRTSKKDHSKIFRSYAMPTCLKRSFIKKVSGIKIPGMRYCFVEEADGRNYNVGPWDFYAPNDPANSLTGPAPEWRDPIAINHGTSGILGFCDGHAESHKWVDSNTFKRLEYYYEKYSGTNYGIGGLTSAFNASEFYVWGQTTDLDYMGQGWAYRFGP